MAKGTPAKGAASTGSGGRPAAGSRSSRARKPPPVVTRQPRPWGWIAAAVVVAIFAASAIGYAVLQVNERNAIADPANLDGLVTKQFAAQLHVQDPVDYGEDSPPFGGTHNPTWPDCNGVVYAIQLANEYAVHALEHGAVWITYNPDLPQDDVDKLAELVQGQSFLFMSPYPGLRNAVSLQSWGHQLFVDTVDDPRIEQYITALRLNPEFTPENGATCDSPVPDFANNPVPAPLPGTPVPNQTAAPTVPTGSGASGSVPTGSAPSGSPVTSPPVSTTAP